MFQKNKYETSLSLKFPFLSQTNLHQQKQKDFKKNMIKKEKHKNERKTEKQSIKTHSHSFKL